MRDALANHNRFASTASPGDEKFSQASQRTYAIFTDQFGREVGAVVEKKTMEPVGPLDFRYTAPLCRGPNHAPIRLYPPRQYVHVTDTMRHRVFVDLESWARDLEEGRVSWLVELRKNAQLMYGEAAPEKVRLSLEGKIPPALLDRVGPMVMPVEFVRAMQAKNRWFLGLKELDGSAPRRPNPSNAQMAALMDLWFSEVQPVMELKDPFTNEAVDPFANESEDAPEPVVEDPMAEQVEYPIMYGPGMWYLSAAHKKAVEAGEAKGFRGNKESALEEIRERQTVAAGTHETWG